MNDVCLIHPFAHALANRTAYPPLGLLYIAAVLEEEERAVRYLDYNLTPTVDKIPDAEIYGIQLHTIGTYCEVERICNAIREQRPESKIVVGGSGVGQGMSRLLLESELADVLVLADGEYTMASLTELPKWEPYYLRSIKGIQYCSAGRVVETRPPTLFMPLDALPFPARHLYDRDKLRDTSGVHGPVGVPATTVITSRGCKYNCAFCCCDSPMHTYRQRSPDNVLREIKHLIDRYEITHYRFVDDIFTYDKRATFALCDQLGLLNVTFVCITHANLLNRKLIKSLKYAGCLEVMLGVESGSPRMLTAMNKQQSLSKVEQVVHWLREAGISSKLFLMVGFPGENAESVNETKRFLERVQPDRVHLSTYIPLPGSDVWAHPEKYGVNILWSRVYDELWFYCDDETSTKGILAIPYGSTIQQLAALRADLMSYVRNEEWKKKQA